MVDPSTARPQDGWKYLEVAQVAIVALDERGRIRLINRKGCEVLGCSAEQAVGLDWFETFVPKALRERVRNVFRELMQGRTQAAEYYENPVLTLDGRERLVAWHNTVLRDDDGRIVGTLSSGEDITDRRRIEESLRRTNKELSDIKYALDQASIVAITDQRGTIRYVNDKFCEISKYSREELLGQDHRLVNSGFHSKAFIRDLWRTIAAGRVWRGEIRNRAKDGTLYWVDTTIVPFLDERRKPYQYLAIRSDITDRKQAEEELSKREALARVGQMAAVLAHEIKNPLAGIAGAIQVIGGRLPAGSPDREVISGILGRIDALNQRLQDVLRFARPRSPRFTTVQLRPLLEDIADLQSRDPRMSGVAVRVDGEDVSLSADGEMLRDLFSNLIVNAAQAMQGAGTIEIYMYAGDSVTVEICDRGPGIAEEQRERVFEPFYTTKSQGTGLGLAIARQVVEAHRGGIEIDGAPGGGTIARVRLPLTPKLRPSTARPAAAGRR